jgi:hypothetical protein
MRVQIKNQPTERTKAKQFFFREKIHVVIGRRAEPFAACAYRGKLLTGI